MLHLVSTKWGLQSEQWLLCKHENAQDPHKSWVWEGKGSRSGAHGSALIPWELWETLCDGPLTYCSDCHMYTSCVHTCLHIIYTQWKEIRSSQTHRNFPDTRTEKGADMAASTVTLPVSLPLCLGAATVLLALPLCSQAGRSLGSGRVWIRMSLKGPIVEGLLPNF